MPDVQPIQSAPQPALLALPIVPDRATDGKPKPYQYRCADCTRHHRCIDRLRITTPESTACQFTPLRFKPNEFMPLVFPKNENCGVERPRKKTARRLSLGRWSAPEELAGNGKREKG